MALSKKSNTKPGMIQLTFYRLFEISLHFNFAIKLRKNHRCVKIGVNCMCYDLQTGYQRTDAVVATVLT